jgi:sugar phosphate isomerase/epimerase
MNPETGKRISRREFARLTSGATAGTAMILGGINTLAGEESVAAPPSPYGGFRMGVQSYSLRHFPFPEALTRIKQLNLNYVELFPGHVDHAKLTAEQLAEEKKRMEDAGITPDAYGVVPFSTDEAAARKIFDFAKFLGLLSISAGPSKDSFDMLDKLVEEYKIPIAIHNHGPQDKWGRPETILEAIKDHHPLIGICCDTGHYLRAKVDPIQAIKLLKGRVYGFHIKDFVDEKTEVAAGSGKLNLVDLIREARDQGFEGSCSLEYELTPEDPMAGMAKGLDNFRKAVLLVPFQDRVMKEQAAKDLRALRK